MSWTLHLPRFGMALALAGCAAAPPPPVHVSDDDLSAVRAIIASQDPDSAASKEFRVSEIEVRDRVVTLELEAESQGRGWERADRAQCRRCADDDDWSCAVYPASIHTQLSSGSWAAAEGLSLEQTRKAIEFLAKRSRSDAQLQQIPRARLAAIRRLRALEEGRVCVEYGPITSVGHLVLKGREAGFEVESVMPPANWFEGTPGIAECGLGLEVGFQPMLKGCERSR